MGLPKRVMVTTYTGEFLQPTRLRFRVVRSGKVKEVLHGVESIVGNADRPGQFLWHYDADAAGVDLPKKPSEIPADLQPVVLADLSFSDPHRLNMRFRSPERAIAAARFFCPRFGDAAVLERLRILNRLVTADEASLGLGAIDRLLDKNVTIIDPEVAARRLDQALASGKTRAEKLAAFERMHEEHRNQDVPEVEDFPVAMEEETPAFTHLIFTLRLRSRRAFEHWKGNPVTLAQLIEDTVRGLAVPPSLSI